MAEIVPAIIAKDFMEVKKKIRQVEPYTKWIQLDIMDGNFVPNITWNNPKDLLGIDFPVFLEVHLMIQEPEKYVDDWINSGIKRIIVHIETIREKEIIQDLAKKCHKSGVGFGIAINLETSENILDPIIEQLDLVLFLTVRPGFGGKKFLNEVLSKIKSFHHKYPYIKIEADGGINPETGKKCLGVGVDILVSGSYIFERRNIKSAIDNLKAITQT